MFGIQTLNKISPAGLNKFGEGYTCGDQVQNPDAVLVRSASMHEMEFPSSLRQSPVLGQASTIFQWTNAAKWALWYSIPPAQTPTR